MEYTDALEYLKILRNLVDITEHDSGAELQRQTYDIAIEAVEKQIAKEPINKKDDVDGSCGYCPNCNNIVDDYHDYKVCQCGQALDWGEKEVNNGIVFRGDGTDCVMAGGAGNPGDFGGEENSILLKFKNVTEKGEKNEQ